MKVLNFFDASDFLARFDIRIISCLSPLSVWGRKALFTVEDVEVTGC